jgi:hypothetical protein
VGSGGGEFLTTKGTKGTKKKGKEFLATDEKADAHG